MPDGPEEIAVGRQAQPLIPHVVPRPEVLLDVVALRQASLGHRHQRLAHVGGAFPRQLVLEGAERDGFPAIRDVRQAVRQQPVGAFGKRVDPGQRPDVGGRTLQHRDMAGARVHQGRDQGDRGGTGADDDDLLAHVVEVLRPVLRMDDLALEVLGAGKRRRIPLVVVVVAGAREQEGAGELALLTVRLDGQGPSVVGVGPIGGHDTLAVADVPVDLVLDRGLVDIGLDVGAVGDRLRRAPGLEPEPEGEHVRVRPDARVFEQVPGAAQVGAAFEDRVALGRAAFLQVPRRADPRDAGAHDDHVKVLSHEATLSTACRRSQQSVESFDTV